MATKEIKNTPICRAVNKLEVVYREKKIISTENNPVTVFGNKRICYYSNAFLCEETRRIKICSYDMPSMVLEELDRGQIEKISFSQTFIVKKSSSLLNVS